MENDYKNNDEFLQTLYKVIDINILLVADKDINRILQEIKSFILSNKKYKKLFNLKKYINY